MLALRPSLRGAALVAAPHMPSLSIRVAWDGAGMMTDPNDLEYCVRDRSGRIVVPWRPVRDLSEARTEAQEAAYLAGEMVARRDVLRVMQMIEHAPQADWKRLHRAELALDALLGLEPGFMEDLSSDAPVDGKQ
jgi:hypothetical protein